MAVKVTALPNGAEVGDAVSAVDVANVGVVLATKPPETAAPRIDCTAPGVAAEDVNVFRMVVAT